MQNNAIVLHDGTGQEIFLTDVDYYVSEYIDTLPDSDMITKPKVFIGLLDYLYEHVIRNIPYKPKTTGQMLDYALIEELFFKVYKPLTARYNMTPTVIGFSTFLRISNTNLSDVKSGYYRSSGNRVNCTASETLQKIYDACESATLTGAIDGNSIGSIFALKANYGYNESRPSQQAIEDKDPDIVDISAITEKYKNVEPPVFKPIE